MTIKNIFLAGVGGQGLVLSNQVIARAALKSGLDVKTSDIYGLAMRGGSVYGYNRIGDRVLTSTFAKGQCDILIALEGLEGLRYAGLLRKGGLVILNKSAVFPSKVLLEKAKYPQDIEGSLKAAGLEVFAIDALSVSLKAGNPKMVNIALVGAFSKRFPQVSEEAFKEAISEMVPQNLIEANLKAFELARALG